MADTPRSITVDVAVDRDQLRDAFARHLLDMALDAVGCARAVVLLADQARLRDDGEPVSGGEVRASGLRPLVVTTQVAGDDSPADEHGHVVHSGRGAPGVLAPPPRPRRRAVRIEVRKVGYTRFRRREIWRATVNCYGGVDFAGSSYDDALDRAKRWVDAYEALRFDRRTNRVEYTPPSPPDPPPPPPPPAPTYEVVKTGWGVRTEEERP